MTISDHSRHFLKEGLRDRSSGLEEIPRQSVRGREILRNA